MSSELFSGEESLPTLEAESETDSSTNANNIPLEQLKECNAKCSPLSPHLVGVSLCVCQLNETTLAHQYMVCDSRILRQSVSLGLYL